MSVNAVAGNNTADHNTLATRGTGYGGRFVPGAQKSDKGADIRVFRQLTSYIGNYKIELGPYSS